MQWYLYIHNLKLFVVYLQFKFKLGILCLSGTLGPGGIILPTESSLLSVPLLILIMYWQESYGGSTKRVNQVCVLQTEPTNCLELIVSVFSQLCVQQCLTDSLKQDMVGIYTKEIDKL